MQRSQWREAAEKLECAARCADLANDAETSAMAGWSRYRLGELDSALAAFERARGLDPSSSYALGGLGATYLALAKPIEARIELERAVRLDPTLEDASWLAPELAAQPELFKLFSPLGWAWYARGDFARAESDFRRAIDKDPLEPTAKRGLAVTLIRAGKSEEGKRAMGEHLATLPKKENPWGGASDVLSEYGWTLYALGDWAGAQKAFRQLAELHAGERQLYADPFDGLGWSLLRSGKPKEARDAFLKAIAIEPRFESSLRGLETLKEQE
jgi:tetratricopeptide (TPR) repeat protein